MALVSGIGAGSGLDIGGLVKQLVDAERQQRSAPINRREARAKAQISAFGSIKSAFDKLKTSLDALKPNSLFAGRTVTTSSAEFVSVRTSSGATPDIGSYEVVVDRLASGQKLRFTEQPTDNELGLGTLRFNYGAAPTDNFEIELTDDNNTLRQLAVAINAKNTDLTASVIGSDTGESLVLTSSRTGAAATVAVTQTAGSGDLSAFETSTPANFTELTAAQDARAFIDGVLVTGASNTFTSAISGVELTLKKLTNGLDSTPDKATISITENLSPARTAIENLVKAYNETTDSLRAQTAYDPETKTASTLTGDSLARGAGEQIRRALGQLIGDAGAAGLDLGFSTDLSGKLSFNVSKFDAAIAANPDVVRGLLSGESSALQQRLGTPVSALLSSDGGLTRRTQSLDEQVTAAGVQRVEMERRITQIEERYRRQFIALDTLLGRLSATSNYLSQQLNSLPGAAQN